MVKNFNVPIEIINMAAEAASNHNDGWTTKHYLDQLKEIRDYISDVLNRIDEAKVKISGGKG